MKVHAKPCNGGQGGPRFPGPSSALTANKTVAKQGEKGTLGYLIHGDTRLVEACNMVASMMTVHEYVY